MTTALRIAELLGAKVIGEVPDAGGGASGAARLAALFTQMNRRDTQPASPTTIPVTTVTEAKLVRLAERASTNGIRISPSELGAKLLEEALAAYPDD